MRLPQQQLAQGLAFLAFGGIGIGLLAAFEPRLLWTLAGLVGLTALVSPLFLVATARAYARMSPDEIKVARWHPSPSPFRRIVRFAALRTLFKVAPFGALVALGSFLLGEWKMTGPIALTFALALAAAQFWIAFQLRRWERRHGSALFREVRVAFGRVGQRLVRAPLGSAGSGAAETHAADLGENEVS